MGACWLIMKTEGELQEKAIGWAKIAWLPVVVGMVLISMATPWISATVRDRWFALPEIIALMTIPALDRRRALHGAGDAEHADRPRPALLAAVRADDRRVPVRLPRPRLQHLPFVVIDQLTIWQAASSPGSAEVHPGRRLHLGAGDRRLHDLFVPRVPGQDGRAEVRLARVVSCALRRGRAGRRAVVAPPRFAPGALRSLRGGGCEATAHLNAVGPPGSAGPAPRAPDLPPLRYDARRSRCALTRPPHA